MNQRPANPKKPKIWKRLTLWGTSGILIASLTFVVASYIFLKQQIIVSDSRTTKAAILDYNPDDKNNTLNPEEFQALGDGRFNMALVGIDKAASLTDSIQILSVDTINKKASLTSIPRDLYVTVPGFGQNKINTAYKLAEGKNKGSGSAMLKEVVSKVLGVSITHYAIVDFSGLEKLVDSVGGIEIDVPYALYDPTFPALTGTGYEPFSIAEGVQKMNGKTALRYARCRNGNCGNDFGRSQRQQQVIDALRNKATSAGIVANPIRINNILQALGQSLKTDLQVGQAQSLLKIINSVKTENNSSSVLDTSAALGLLTSSSDTPAGYISFPVLGIEKYSAIQRWFIKNNPDPLQQRELPTIALANSGKATDKQMTELQALLEDFGYKVTLNTTPLPNKYKTGSTTLYQANNSGKKPFSHNYLSTQFDLEIQNGSPLGSDKDFELIYAPGK